MACEKYSCRCCGRIIADCRERRLLQSDANSDTRELLVGLLNRGRNNEDLILGTSASYVCRVPCFTTTDELVLRARRYGALSVPKIDR